MNERSLTLLKKLGVAAVPLVALAFIWAVAIAPIFQLYDDLDAETEQLKLQLERYMALSGQKQAFADDLKRLKEGFSDKDLFFSAPNANAAAAALQQKVSEVILGNGAQMRTARIEVKPAKANAQTVMVHVIFAASTRSLNQILFQFENARPLVFVDTLSIHGGPILSQMQNARTGTPREPPTVNDPVLEVALSLSALTPAKS